jgi:hypothetical protein
LPAGRQCASASPIAVPKYSVSKAKMNLDEADEQVEDLPANVGSHRMPAAA